MNKILQRFIDVWKLDFLARFVAGEHNNNKVTIGFWFLFNMLTALFFAISFGFFLFGFEDDIAKSINEYVPDGAEVAIVNGQLHTKNVDEPLFREFNAQNQYSDAQTGKYVVIVDGSSQTYDITSLDEYAGGIVALNDRIFVKNETEVKQIVLADVPNFTLDKEQSLLFVDENFIFPIAAGVVAVIFLILFIGYALFRLVSALWWALMLFIIAKIFDVQLQYVVAYKAVLNFYFIPTLVIFLVSFAVIQIPLLVTAVFIVIFVTNLWWMKKNTIEEFPSVIVEKKEQEMIAKTIDKS